MQKLLLLLTTLLLALHLQAAPELTRTESPQPALLSRLSKARTPSDSVKILYDLWDCSTRVQQPTWGRMLINTAQRAHDYAACNDILRQMSVLYGKSDSVMNELEALARKMPNSADKRVTVLFIAQQRLASQAIHMDEKQRAQRVAALMDAYTHPATQDDVYDQISRLFSITTILGQATQGQLYMEALERLHSLVDQLPAEGQPIRSQYFTALANIYTNNDRSAEALKADRRLLSIIDSLEQDYHRRGRVHRSYAQNRFLCYRRMLQNYRGLKPAEVEDLWSKVQELIKQDYDVASNEERTPRSQAYYLMATGRYEEAIPVLQALLSAPRMSMNQRRQILKELRIAAEATGNKAVLLQALQDYTDIIDQYDSLRTSEAMSELAIRYEVSRLRGENNKLEQAAIDKERTQRRQVSMILGGVCALLAIIMLIVLRSMTRIKRRLNKLQRENIERNCEQ